MEGSGWDCNDPPHITQAPRLAQHMLESYPVSVPPSPASSEDLDHASQAVLNASGGNISEQSGSQGFGGIMTDHERPNAQAGETEEEALSPAEEKWHPADREEVEYEAEVMQEDQGGDASTSDHFPDGYGENGLLPLPQRRSSLKRQNSWAHKDPVSLSGSLHTHVWGNNDSGQLGLGTTESFFSSPQLVVSLKGREVVLVSGSLFNTAFLLADGDLLLCGSNEDGQLGWDPSKPPSQVQQALQAIDGVVALTLPSRVASLDAFSVHHIALGMSHATAIVGEGTLSTWGANDYGQLGQGTEGNKVTHPKLVKRARSNTTVRAAAGQLHTLTLNSAGIVSSFGHNEFGQLGRQEEEGHNTAGEVKSLWPVGVIQIACGDNHSAVLSSIGNVYTWGRGKYGQLGFGNLENSNQPRRVELAVAAVQIDCGADHTLALTQAGNVFSWGRSNSGQTGHGSIENISAPRLIDALEREEVVQISAGRSHSLALSRRGIIYGFGANQLGQLGLGTQVDQLLPAATNAVSHGLPLFVVAAGDHSIAVCQSLPSPSLTLAGPHGNYGAGLVALSLPCFTALVDAAKKSNADLVKLRHAVADIFSNPGYLMHCVGVHRSLDSQPGQASTRITALFAKILEVGDEEVAIALVHAVSSLLDRLISYSTQDSALDRSPDFALAKPTYWEYILFILFQIPLNTGAIGRKLVKKLISAAVAFGPEFTVRDWVQRLTTEKFKGLFLRPLQRYLSYVAVHQGTMASRKDLLEALVFLDALHTQWRKLNDADGKKLPPSEFHNLEIGENLQLAQEYMLWQQFQEANRTQPATLASVCQLPFCLTPEAKANLLKIECQIQRHTFFQQGLLQGAMRGGRHRAHLLDLHITREHLLSNVMSQISSCPIEWLKLPLVVHFSSNGVPEEGVDQGGVAKEFFQLLMKAIFEEDLGMFTLDEATRNFWFNYKAIYDEGDFRVLGKMIGLAVYNGVILDIHFPPVFYKKLNMTSKDSDLGFQDLKESFPEVARGLQQLLDLEGDVESLVCRDFVVEYDYYGEMRRVPLKQGGESIPVTNNNRGEFVALYTKWQLHDSISAQFSAFEKGFHEVCGGPALSLFSADELELVICGIPQLNFEDLESVARYEGDYNQQHPEIKALWSILHGFTFEEKKSFLKFTTGCDRAPVGGLGNLTMTIQRAGPDSEDLPTSHTCFNYLLLPEYSSKEKLHDKLRLAINYAEGFGLE